MGKEITGQCRHGVYRQNGDPCYFCGFCTVDGHDYADNWRNGKPDLPGL